MRDCSGRAGVITFLMMARISCGLADEATPAEAPAAASQLDEIVVTAQRRAQSISTVPLAITAQDGDTLARQGIGNSAELASAVPNLQISSPYGNTQPNFSLRGISVANEYNSNQASPIGVYIDDVYIAARTSQGMGAGLSLAVSGDVVVAARSSHFTVAYSAIGLTPDGGLSWLLPRLVGLRKAQEMILTNRRVASAEAESIGLVTRVVDDEALEAEGLNAATHLARSATAALGAARSLLLESFPATLETHLEREARAISAASAGGERQEGIAAFLAKRKPDFA